MANRRALISGLHGGGRFRINTADKIPLCRLWEKDARNKRKRWWGLVRQIWVAYPDEKFHHNKLWEKEAAAYTQAIPSCGNATYSLWIPGHGLDKSGTCRKKNMWGPPTPRTRRRNPCGGDIFCLISLSLFLPFPSLHLSPSFFSLCLSLIYC